MSENIEAVCAIYAAFNQGEMQKAVELASPDIEWVPHEFDLSGTVRGREQVLQELELYTDSYAENVVQTEKFFEKDDQVVAFLHNTARGRASGVELDIHVAQLWSFRAGKPVRVQTYYEPRDALRAAGLEE